MGRFNFDKSLLIVYFTSQCDLAGHWNNKKENSYMGSGKLFSQDTVNSGRQPAFDLCKTICIVLMIMCHVFYLV